MISFKAAKETSSFIFKTGLKVKYASAEHIVMRSKEDLVIQCSNLAKALPKELGQEIRRKYGRIAIFGVMDGHGLKPSSFGEKVNSELAQQLLKSWDTHKNVPFDLRLKTCLTESARLFPKNLHETMKEEFRNKTYGSISGGTTFSFVVITEPWTVHGILGDSPVCVIKKGKVKDELQTHDSGMIPYKKLGFGCRIKKLSETNTHISYPHCDGSLAMYNSLGDFGMDLDLQEAFYELQAGCTPQHEEAIKRKIGRFHRYRNSTFWDFEILPDSQKPDFSRHPNIFSRTASIAINKTADLEGAFICTDGLFPSVPAELISKAWGLSPLKQFLKKLEDNRQLRIWDDASVVVVKFCRDGS